MTDSDFDDNIINPATNPDALLGIHDLKIEEEDLTLTLMVKRNGKPIQVYIRYLPCDAAHNFELDDGRRMHPDEKVFHFKRTFDELLDKMNGYCLKNVKIINDLAYPKHTYKGNEIKFSHIAPGEYTRLREKCFPGASDSTADSPIQADVPSGKGRKGLRGGQPSAPGE
jgi:hypothetical protein